MKLSFRGMIVMFLCLPWWLAAQTTGGLSMLEREVLHQLMANKQASAVGIFSPDRKFGVKDLPANDALMVVKTAGQIFFVSQRTGFVFVPKDENQPLVRVDSNSVFGGEYHVDAFARHDSLFALGSSEFLKGKGFIAYFDIPSHAWKSFRGNDQVTNEATIPFYDPVKDQLYVITNYEYMEHVDTARKSNNRVLRYDFGSNTWENLGNLAPVVEQTLKVVSQHQLWISPFGVGNVDEGNLNVVIPALNHWRMTNKGFRQTMAKYFPSYSDTSRIQQLLYIGDTLYAFTGTEQSMRMERMKVLESDFTVQLPIAFFVEDEHAREEEESAKNHLHWYYVIPLLLVVAAGAITWQYRKRSQHRDLRLVEDKAPMSNGTSAEGQQGTAFTGDHAAQYFLNSLNAVEKSLVLELSRFAMRKEMMDTQYINQILGVSHKEPEVQKVRRSLTITRINSNFAQMLYPDTAFIRREKDANDKRVFRYFVEMEHAERLLAVETTGDSTLS